VGEAGWGTIPRHAAPENLCQEQGVALADDAVTLEKIVNGAQGIGKLGGILQKLAYRQAL
jgi:hypothetical protein